MTETRNQETKTKFNELLPKIPEVYNSVKIKQEKITPPTSPSHSPSTITKSVNVKQENASDDDSNLVSENIVGESVFASLLSSEDKKAVELTKSSEELLAELFEAFNSAPPVALSTEEATSTKKAKKKHKKYKKKKHKKKGRSSSDEENVDERGKTEKKVKLKKVKKEKKDKVLQVKDIKVEKDKAKKRKLSDNQSVSKHKKKKKEKTGERNDDLDIDKYEKELLDKVQREENSKSESKTKSKIVIKSLKNSAVYEESLRQAEEKQKEKERRSEKYDDGEISDTDQSKSSEISLSDEETYERNRSRLYERESYYGTRTRDDRKASHRERSPRNRSRDRYETSYYGHGYRGLGSRCDDRDRDRRRRRSRSRSHRRDNSEDRIDKKRLLEIARKNAISMLKNGTLPGNQNLAPAAKEKVLAKMRFGDFHSISVDREPIVMNIKNATPIPPKTAEQTKAILMQFPVSSGSHHRLNESEWVPVPQPPKKPPAAQPKALTKVEKPAKNSPQAIMPAPAPPVPEPVPVADTNIFPDATTGTPLDVTSIITKRLNAMRKLQDNPLDQEAIKLMYNTQKDMSAWANSKFIPGQFTGSTGANILSARELTSGFQAWAKRRLHAIAVDKESIVIY